MITLLLRNITGDFRYIMIRDVANIATIKIKHRLIVLKIVKFDAIAP